MTQPTNEQINKMAAEVLGICDEHIWVNESSSGLVLCKICKRSKHHESTYPDFCNDLNAAQRLVKEVGRSSRGRYELTGAVGYLLFGERDYPSDTDIADALLLPAKTITLAALVAAGKISIEDAKESL